MNKTIKIVATSMFVIGVTLQMSAQSAATRNVVSPVQAGTLVLDNNDKATVSLSTEVLNELQQKDNGSTYYVVFTPVKQNVSVAVTDKGDKTFSVVANDGKNSTKGVAVDYVVFVKQTISVVDPSAAKVNRGTIGVFPAK